MRERLLPWIVLALVGAGVLAFRPRSVSSGPEAVVEASFAAARAGDTRAYLACFSAALRGELEAARQEFGEERFRDGLRRRGAAVKGVALARVPGSGEDADEVVLTVESVFGDRNEEQEYRLARRRGRWRIAAMGPARTVGMPIPYGSSVMPGEPQQGSEVTPSKSAPEAAGE
ncbi:MAG: hypothetical protein JXR77_11965 [Lentisphaeria bacterium]|nr:hypothetical protein [Lentisphaeria bacterium]